MIKNDIMEGLYVPKQVPLDPKKYIKNEELLKDLGVANRLAYTYHKGLKVTCIDERTEFEWKEIEDGDIGLLPSNFTYPNNIIVDGVIYSNKIYNFVSTIIPPVVQNNFVKQILIDVTSLPDPYTKQDVVDYILALPEIDRTILETTSKINIIIDSV